jgi:hypothetical protein
VVPLDRDLLIEDLARRPGDRLVSEGRPGRCQVRVNIAFRMATFAVDVTLRNSRYSRIGDGPSGVIVGRSPLLLRAKQS